MPIRGLPNGAAALVHAIHTPDAVLRNRWTPPSGMGGGRHVPESVVVMNRCAQAVARGSIPSQFDPERSSPMSCRCNAAT